MKSYSQANQDLFVLLSTQGKKDGWFLEIGANDPIFHSNTYLLEKNYGWKGIMVEYLSEFASGYKEQRPKSWGYIADATKFDYLSAMKEHHFPSECDYLQIDLDVNNRSTLTCLEKLDREVFPEYKFATVTFEHDIYSGNWFNTQEEARAIFKKRGYLLLFADVQVDWQGGWKSFEDWYVHPDLIKRKLPEAQEMIPHTQVVELLKEKVLIFNHQQKQCGVYQYGKRLSEILLKDELIEYHYEEVTSADDYRKKLQMINPKTVIHNYHGSTMSWLNDSVLDHSKKNIILSHESATPFSGIKLNINPVEGGIPRPLFELDLKVLDNEKFENPFLNIGVDSGVPVIGSFGFGFDNKGYEKIIDLVNQEFDEAIIKLLIPFAFFGDAEGKMAKERINNCLKRNKKKGIQIHVSHDFLSDRELLKFLRNNDINLFLYDQMIGRGPSSTIDYALSVQKPIGISESYMFRHIMNEKIIVGKNKIKEVIERGNQALEVYQRAWNLNELRARMRSEI